MMQCVRAMDTPAVLVSENGVVLAHSESALELSDGADFTGLTMLQCERWLMLDLAAPAERTFVTLTNGEERCFRVRRTTLGSRYLLSALPIETADADSRWMEPAPSISSEVQLEEAELLRNRLERLLKTFETTRGRLCVAICRSHHGPSLVRFRSAMAEAMPPGDVLAMIAHDECAMVLAGVAADATHPLFKEVRNRLPARAAANLQIGVAEIDQPMSVADALDMARVTSQERLAAA